MTQANNSIVFITQESLPSLLRSRAVASDSFEHQGELFSRAQIYPDWLGFYDWLRDSRGQLLGIRLRFDNPEWVGLVDGIRNEGVSILGSILTLRITLQGQIAEDQSDDADFGGNAVYIGNKCTLAMVFFDPKS